MQGHIGASLGAIGIVTAIIGAAMAGLGAPWWAWVGFAIWGLLWVTAASGLSDEASRKFLAGTLRKSTFTQIYIALTRRNVMGIWTRLCDPAPDGASVGALFRAALTWRLYDVALLLAVAYPILLLVGQWVVTGSEGRMGNFTVLPAADFWPDRATMFVTALILIAGVVGRRLAFASTHSMMRKVAGWLIPIAVAVAVAVAVAGALIGEGALALSLAVVVAVVVAVAVETAGAVALAVALAVAVVLANAVAFAGALAFSVTAAGAFAFAFAFALALAGALGGALGELDRRDKPGIARILLTCLVIGAVLGMAIALDWTEVPEDRRSLLLFLTVLPLLNALFDVVSYACTLSLIRRGLRAKLPLLFGLADLGIACVLLLWLGAALVAVIHGLNLLAGVPFLKLPGLFAEVQALPWGHVWLYLMLFSTLLPTLLHGMLSLLGLQGIWPRGLRRPVAGWVEAAPASPLHALRASLSLSLVWALPLLGLAGVLWLIWHYAQPALVTGLQIYLDGLLWIAAHPVGAL